MSMTWEDYKDQVFADAKEELETSLEDYAAYYDDFSEIFDVLQVCTTITGNDIGSYTFNRWQAMDNLSELIWDADFIELFTNYGYEGIPMDMGPEAVDVIARCLALDELYDELEAHYDQLIEDKQDELAPAYIEANSNLCQVNAYRALEYLSDATDGTPMKLAERYASSLYQLDNETPDQWMAAHPNDTLITDPQGILSAFVITDEQLYR